MSEPTKQDAIMAAAKAYAEQAARVSEQVLHVDRLEREARQAGCNLSNMRRELVKLKTALDTAVAGALEVQCR